MKKGSDIVKMTLNIGGELIKLDVDFDDQVNVRDTENDIKRLIERLKKAWPDHSDRNILAMAVYQFASWYNQLKQIQQDIIEITDAKTRLIEKVLNGGEEESFEQV